MFLLWNIGALLFVGLFLLGCAIYIADSRSHGPESTQVGWVYFISPIGGAVQEPPAPIKIGMTWRDPYNERLPELETGSAQQLEVLHAEQSHSPAELEKVFHRALEAFRVRGEWFDRDATLAFIDHYLNGV